MNDVRLRDRSVASSAMPKVYWRILPLICLAYLCAYMDRVNVSFASVQMNVDLQFSATIYGLGGGLFFLGYALFEVPSNLLLVRFGARQWLARIMVTWGLLASA
jgi:ACS family tartrate transporter-like MFS transporter